MKVSELLEWLKDKDPGMTVVCDYDGQINHLHLNDHPGFSVEELFYWNPTAKPYDSEHDPLSYNRNPSAKISSAGKFVVIKSDW